MQRREVVRAHVALVHLVVFPVVGAAGDPDPCRVAVEVDGTSARDAHRPDARQAGDAAHDLARQCHGLLILLVADPRGGHVQRGHPIGLEPEAHVHQAVEALAEQPRPDQQDHGGRQLEDDELRTKAVPRVTRRSAASVGHASSHLRERRAQGGRD